MKKILFVFGTRPEAIKLAPVVSAFQKERAFQTIICVTAQHRQMLDQLLTNFKVKTDIDLNLMLANQTLFDITANALRSLEAVLSQTKPDLLFVQGDTTTAFAAALAAFYKKIPVAHVEAGLRSFDLEHPYPEELNRVYIDRVAALLFAPTPRARKNLLREGVPASQILVTGNTGIDALNVFKKKNFPFKNTELKDYFENLPNRSRVILLTAHRRENFGRPLEEIAQAVLELREKFQDIHFVYPVHLNPNVRKTVQSALRGKSRILLTEPLDYFDLIEVMKRSYLILTDSGGIQEEAPSFGKPTIVLRKVTERPEAVQAGCARVVGDVRRDRVVKIVSSLLRDARQYRKMARVKNPFGDGRASGRIVKRVKSFFNR